MHPLQSRRPAGRWSIGSDPLPVHVSRVAFLVLTAGFALAWIAGIRLPIRVQAAGFLFGMVVLNLPHGGFEHFDNLRFRTGSFQLSYIAVYVLAIAAFVGVLFVSPVLGLAGAITVAVAKGGIADLAALDATGLSGHLTSGPQRWLAAAVRGGAIMLVPMIAWPETFYTFSSYMVSIFAPGALAAWHLDLQTNQLLLTVGFGSLLVAHLVVGFRRRDSVRTYAIEAGETLLLVGYFIVVPVVLAVGLYFPLWYSARQVGRATLVTDEPADGTYADGLLSVLDSADPTYIALGAWGVLIAGAIATFGLGAILFLIVPNPFGGAPLLPGLVAFWAIFISVVAFPHVLIGSFWDRERGIWYVPRPEP